mgnify:CR=1 FL=1
MRVFNFEDKSIPPSPTRPLALQAFNQLVLGKIEEIINAAGNAMKGASSTLIRSKEEAQRRLDQARTDVANAQKAVDYARGAFEAARRKVGICRAVQERLSAALPHAEHSCVEQRQHRRWHCCSSRD